MATLELPCDLCAEVRVFAQPVCEDHHTADCPEWACTGCGAAVLIAPGVLLVDRSAPVHLDSRRPRTRQQTRRAA